MQISLPYQNVMLDLDSYTETLTAKHARGTPFWTKYQDKRNFRLDEIKNFDDLLQELPVFPSRILNEIDPKDVIASMYHDDSLIESISSGTTGPRKIFYWHPNEARTMQEFAAYTLNLQRFPRKEKWFGTITTNRLLKMFLCELAITLEGDFEGIEVTDGIVSSVKKAAETKNINEMVNAYSPVVKNIVEFVQGDRTVYEDATLGLLLGGNALQKENLNKKIKGILFGGVATSAENLSRVRELFPDAVIDGWYGNHFTGTMMHRHDANLSSLKYQSMFPYVTTTVRRYDNPRELVNYGERGVIVATRATEYSLLSLELGDEGTRINPIEPLMWDAISDISRIPEEKMKTLKEKLNNL